MTLTYSNQTFTPILHRLAGRIRGIPAEARNRMKLRKDLGNLKAHHLRDIGLTEQDVISAGYVPLSCDAAEKLVQMARVQSSNW